MKIQIDDVYVDELVRDMVDELVKGKMKEIIEDDVSYLTLDEDIKYHKKLKKAAKLIYNYHSVVPYGDVDE